MHGDGNADITASARYGKQLAGGPAAEEMLTKPVARPLDQAASLQFADHFAAQFACWCMT